MGIYSEFMEAVADIASFVERRARGQRLPRGFPFAAIGAPVASVGLSGAWVSQRLEQVRHFNSWTYVAVSRIAEKVAQTQPQVSVLRSNTSAASPPDDVKSEEGYRLYLQKMALKKGQKSLRRIQHYEQLEPVDCDHRLVRLLNEANPFDTAYDLFFETSMFLDLTGNAYWWLEKDRLGLPRAVWVLPSHWVWPVFSEDKRLILGYELRPTDGKYKGVFLPEKDVIHFKCKSPLSKTDGFAPLQGAAHWVDSNEMIDRSMWHAFQNGITPSMILEIDPIWQDPDGSKLERISARLDQRYSGETNTRKAMVLPPGFQAKSLQLTPSEMLFGESANRMRDNILAAFAVPPVVAGLSSNMTYGALYAGMAGFCAFRINPRLLYFGQVLTEKLARRFDEKLVVWWPDSTPEDVRQREAEIQTDIRAQAISPDELRAIRGRPPWDPSVFPGGNKPCGWQNNIQGAGKPSTGSVNNPDYGSTPHGGDAGGEHAPKEIVDFEIKRLLESVTPKAELIQPRGWSYAGITLNGHSGNGHFSNGDAAHEGGVATKEQRSMFFDLKRLLDRRKQSLK